MMFLSFIPKSARRTSSFLINTRGVKSKIRMADLFIQQADQYAVGRPTYPDELFDFIASKTPCRDFVWDVGTGSGQAALPLAKIYKNVIATDTSPKQLEFASKFPNIYYKCTPPNMSMTEIQHMISSESSLDLITIAQALHWFDFSTFYQQVKWLLKKPDGVIAAWCYTLAKINDKIDPIFRAYYSNSQPYWEPERKLVDLEYRSIDFPFEGVDGFDEDNNTGPFQFKSEKVMDLNGFFTYLRSWSAYQTAKNNGVELLTDDVVKDFMHVWNEDGNNQKVVTFPIFLRIGRVGTSH